MRSLDGLLASFLVVSFADDAAALSIGDTGEPPSDSFPQRNSSIPTNARIVFFGESETSFLLANDGPDVSLAFTREETEDGTLLIVEPGALTAGQELSILPICDCAGDPEAFTFTVDDRVDDTPPVFESGEVEIDTRDDPISPTITAALPPVDDDSGRSLILIETDEGRLFHTRSDGASLPVIVTFDVERGPLRTVCATVTAFDIAGNDARFDEPLCVEVGGEAGCTQSSAPALLAGLALFLRGRRRR